MPSCSQGNASTLRPPGTWLLMSARTGFASLAWPWSGRLPWGPVSKWHSPQASNHAEGEQISVAPGQASSAIQSSLRHTVSYTRFGFSCIDCARMFVFGNSKRICEIQVRTTILLWWMWVHPKKYNLAWHPYGLEDQSITRSQQLAAAQWQPQVKSCMIAHWKWGQVHKYDVQFVCCWTLAARICLTVNL